jgi:hypothetical protein
LIERERERERESCFMHDGNIETNKHILLALIVHI